MRGPIDESWYVRADGLPDRVSAGGAVVRIAEGAVHVALVRELDNWGAELDGYVLPKGQVEGGEGLEAAAVREVEEEAGLTDVENLGHLTTLERQDLEKQYWAICEYYLFKTEQVEGDIKDKDHHFGLAWFPLDSLPKMFWPDEQELLERERLAIYDRVIAHQNPKGRKKGFM